MYFQARFFWNMTDVQSNLYSNLPRLWIPVGNKSLCVWLPGSHQPVLPRGGYMRSPSWTRCSKVEPPRERKHHSDSDTAEPLMKLERPKQPWYLMWKSRTAERAREKTQSQTDTARTEGTQRGPRGPPSATVCTHNVSWCWTHKFRLNSGHL